MPYVIEWYHKGQYPARMFLRKNWSGYTSHLKDADVHSSREQAARAVNRSGCAMDDDVEIVQVDSLINHSEILMNILRQKEILPLLIGIDEDLDVLIEQKLKNVPVRKGGSDAET